MLSMPQSHRPHRALLSMRTASKIAALLLAVTLIAAAPARAAEPKHIVMIAGNPSHGFGMHEHHAGLRLLADTLERSDLPVKVTVTRGWPEDPTFLQSADSIVIFSDGGGGHLALRHRDQLRARIKKGTGFVCLHYATEVPKGPEGNDWLEFLGGYFETHWSVNPHWVAKFDKLPKHPVTSGVKPFEANDEWYFHLRFAPPPAKITPILQAVAPEATMRRPDGPHSGNPDARKSVAAGEPQTVAWTFERPDGGRSFGFTGAHYHWNWGNASMLRLVTNAIAWTAGVEIPSEGVSLETPGVKRLLDNQDYAPPKDFDAERVAKEFSLTATTINRSGAGKNVAQKSAKPRLLGSTPVLTAGTPGHQAKLEVELKGARDLYLVVSDGGDGFACDWAAWVGPEVYSGDKNKSLLEMEWKKATSQWGSVGKNRNADGQPISIDNKEVKEPAIGTHANSVIHYQIPEGFTHFRATAGLDTGGTKQTNGATSVRFWVFADAEPNVMALEKNASDGIRDPANAVAGLEIGEGLEMTLAASEPELRSLTNLDIDDRGRVWVCDVMNYRGNNGSRPEGDRILILEDTNGDGVMDKSKVFYQGRDIDSAMGICVLGNEVIVSAAPYIWRLIDTDGDDVADKKVAMFTDTGQPQHDHSNHSFIFGPDGKLYWNVGNTGKHVKDADGKVVVDIHGRPVIDNGKPFFGGMPFRCNLDGSEFEVLAHNFRNNWETTIDSFGTLWQSDNDDDGNRGTRINFVMEHGNYGYRDEMTGAAWQTPRINMESEIPQRHWHLNDPGVVPNVLLTGAGSPSGICLYEGDLLPKRFHNQMIHCDPGPNMVRAYPVTAEGAGYTATIDPIATGTRDKWFRPADVCVAPDGSLFVTDWYDPGVGGHRQEDVDRGRLFRIAPPGTPYKVPKFDYSTAEGAADALRNPAIAVRYKAWMALHAMGRDAIPALTKLYNDENPRIRARAIWLLGKIEGEGERYVRQGLSDADADIRITAIRLMRQIKLTPSEFLQAVVDDSSPAVRREALVALRYDRGEAMPKLWAKLASHHDGDRWYLEALGLASDLRASECYEALKSSGQLDLASDHTRDVLWRLRAPQAAETLVSIIADPKVTLTQTDRYFRALEFHPIETRSKALSAKILTKAFASVQDKALQEKHDAVIVRAIERCQSASTDEPSLQMAVNRYVESRKGTAEYLQLVKRFAPKGVERSLIDMAMNAADDNTGVEAIRLLAAAPNGQNAIKSALSAVQAADQVPSNGNVALIRRLGLLGSEPAVESLATLVVVADAPYDVRSEAVRGLSKNNLGAKRLLDLVKDGKLPGDVKLLAGGLLAKSNDKTIRSLAEKWLPLPAQADSKPLPPLDELAKMSGNATHGEALFRTKGTCANCHIVKGHGKQVGPDLSEIGTKLSRESLFTSILDPSAGISHNYENFIVLLESGQVVSGLKISETETQVTIRTADAIDRVLSQDEITEIKQSEKSIMPDNLHHTVDQQGLVDIVEYMTTLKKL
jgi:putative membrane-bound dehydrogenase-like protein